MTTVDEAPTRRALIDTILGNPLVGLSPWILYSIVEGEGRLELSAALALGLAVVILCLNWLRGSAPKMLENADNIWTGWIIQTFPMIVAAQFTIWYPNRLDAVREGRAETAPTVRDFLATVTPWITVIGILVLSLGGGPEWLGIALHRPRHRPHQGAQHRAPSAAVAVADPAPDAAPDAG